MPCLISVVKDINEPRLPSLRGKMLAKKAEFTVWGHQDLDVDPDKIGLKGSPTWVERVFTPPPRSGGKIFEGESEEVVSAFIQAVQEDNILQK
jgi:electron transfer flavoprotein beta subunit